ncbi:MAG TPA: helix-turn-helix domain-containing protein [Burkholderiales bacterium]|nr:helix-turn-helix domain-containing protein [Burkholderiales bacterium]
MNIAEQVHAPEVEPAVVEPRIGDALTAARQAQNLSVIDVANRLKLSVQQVEALEQGAYERLPGPVFVRGFTRNYARLLKLDPDAMVRAVDAQLPHAVPASGASSGETNIPMPAKSNGRWPIIAGLAAVVFLGAALVDVLWPESPSPGVAGAPSAPAPDASPAPVASTAPAVESPAAAQPAPAAASAIAPAPVTPPAAMTANYEPGANRGGAVVRLAFEQQSWVQVRDAGGKVILEALFPAGSSRQIDARPPLTLVIGNAPGVRLTYGDRAIDLAPHTRVAVARLTLE